MSGLGSATITLSARNRPVSVWTVTDVEPSSTWVTFTPVRTSSLAASASVRLDSPPGMVRVCWRNPCCAIAATAAAEVAWVSWK